MRKSVIFLISASGYILALSIVLFSAFTEENKELIDCREPAKADNNELHAQSNETKVESGSENNVKTKIMRAYILPHPPEFTQGKWITFTNFQKDNNHVVFFLSNGQTLTVESSAIDWTGQRLDHTKGRNEQF